MAKTFPTLTDVATGDVLTSTGYNNVQTYARNFRVPPACRVVRTSNLTGYTSASAITWSSAVFDTESPSDPMWAAGSPTVITIRTAGLYLVEFVAMLGASATTTEYEAIVTQSGAPGSAIRAYHKTGNTTGTRSVLTGIVQASVGNTLSASLSIVGGSAYSINGNATGPHENQSRLTVVWLGQVS